MSAVIQCPFDAYINPNCKLLFVGTIILIDIYIWEQMDFKVVLHFFPPGFCDFLTFEMQERLLSNVNNHSRRVISGIIWWEILHFFPLFSP